MMNPFMKTANVLLAACCLAGCSPRAEIQVSVRNPIGLPRENEMVEIPAKALAALHLGQGELPVILDRDSRQIPCQLTHDSLLVFPVSVAGNAEARYTLTRGTPVPARTLACGRQYPERLDDLAWENDKAAYRAYGPALERTGEKAFGYDVFTKSVAGPVVEERYRMDLDPVMRAEVRRLKEKGEDRKADSLMNARSYHVDHGNGMDCYGVGATLGGGTAALMPDSAILYPYAYRKCEILDNGPLRFTARLTYAPFALGKDTAVTETRLVTLDQGSHLNRTEVSYEGLSAAVPVVTGIVIRPQDPDGYGFDRKARYMAYADPTDCADCGNGTVYIGAAFVSAPESITLQRFDEKERKEHSGAWGHLLGGSTYRPGSSYTYYWGSGWSKAGIEGMEAWERYLKDYALRLESPLRITCN